jgi:hypothetical protein
MSLTYNNYKSTTVRGAFNNSDYSDGSILASATFDRIVTVKGDLSLGNEVIIRDTSGNIIGYTDTGGNIKFSLNGVNYNIAPTQLKQLTNPLATVTDISAIYVQDYLKKLDASNQYLTIISANTRLG